MKHIKTKNSVEFDKTKTYKVFISYCWSSPEHENWVYNLAERLMNDGIEVKYDKWDLKEGQDKNAFMESMVTDETIDKVLVICNKEYKEKADKRKGGVGTETQIITSELYDKIEQTKFIPIIAEQGEQFDSYMPIYIKSRIGIDLSKNETFEDEYEKLLRAITERPKYRKPKLGKLPTYLFDEENSNYRTRSIVASFKNNLYKNPQQALFLANDFINEFVTALNKFQLEREDLTDPYDDVIYNQIHEMQKLRDDYIEFIDSWSNNNDLFAIDKVISLFEDIYKYTEYQGSGSFSEEQTDHYKFFIMELFLYTNMILLKNNSYKNVSILINNKYFVNRRFSSNDNPCSFRIFQCGDLKSLLYRNQRLNARRVSYTTDMLIERAVCNGIDYKGQIIETDLLLYYISHLMTHDMYQCWFPMTHIYISNAYGFKIDVLRRLISKRHFEKVKVLFSVNTVEELKQLFSSFNEEINNYMRYSGTWSHVPSLSQHINYEAIGTSI